MKILGPERDMGTGDLWSVLPTQYCCDEIKENEMGAACTTYGEEERCIQGFGGKTWKKQTTLKTLA
jgi:hypothetical protein